MQLCCLLNDTWRVGRGVFVSSRCCGLLKPIAKNFGGRGTGAASCTLDSGNRGADPRVPGCCLAWP